MLYFSLITSFWKFPGVARNLQIDCILIKLFIIESRFVSFFNPKRPIRMASGRKGTQDTRAKRLKSGHEKTRMGICLLCFHHGKKKFWLSRGNQSTLSKHLASSHKNESTSVNDAVLEDSPLAAEAVRAYRIIMSG